MTDFEVKVLSMFLDTEDQTSYKTTGYSHLDEVTWGDNGRDYVCYSKMTGYEENCTLTLDVKRKNFLLPRAKNIIYPSKGDKSNIGMV